MKADYSYLKNFIVRQKCLPYFLAKRIEQKKRERMNYLRSLDRNLRLFYSDHNKVYSFDVFDTVLTRKTGSPLGVFRHVRKDLQRGNGLNVPKALQENFCDERVAAEKETRAQLKKEININDIYRTLAQKFELSDELRDSLMKKEIQFEKDLVEPIPKVVDILNKLHEQKKRVIFISDMYLPEEVIREMLIKIGAYQAGDKVYVSNTYEKTKRSGALFQHVFEQEGCSPSEVIHVGDDLQADIISPQKLGVRGVYYTAPHLSRYETIMLNRFQTESTKGYFYEQLAGASKLTRLNNSVRPEAKRLHSIGADLAGPILFGYVSWILNEAKKQNLKRLYFIARDGQILIEVAKIVQKRMNSDLELRYLYASRHALVLPAALEMGEDELNLLLVKEPTLTVRLIASRAEIDPITIKDQFKEKTGKSISIDQDLSQNEIQKLRQLLKESPLSELILKKASQRRVLVEKYFKQEGLCENLPMGVVDLGWQGTIQDSIKKVLNLCCENKNKILYGYYFGLNPSKGGAKLENNIKRGYYFAPDNEQPKCPIRWEAMNIMEILTTADHGLTMGYQQENDGSIRPKLKEQQNEDALRWGLEYLRRGICDYLEALPGEIFENVEELQSKSFKEFITKSLKAIQDDPTESEAVTIGEHPIKLDPAETYSMSFAPPFDLLTSMRYVLTHRKKYLTNWLEASYVRSSLLGKCVLAIYFRTIYAGK